MPKACILGLNGPRLSGRERAFFAEADPYGFILFERNCQTPDQVRRLVAALREISGRADAPILIDQEGGRVARLKPPHWRAAPPAAAFGELHRADAGAAARAVRLNGRLIGAELFDLGINVDCAPVLDIQAPGADPVIGDRAFSDDPVAVAALGRAFCDGLLASGVLPVIKHIPGHGRAGADSHVALPRVAAARDMLAATDFVPFKPSSGGPASKPSSGGPASKPSSGGPGSEARPWAMTGHVVFETIDPENPATLSARVIEEVIRGDIGFDGILITDDLSMEALSGPLAARARKAMGAGCNLNLHCNGKMEEMAEVALESPELSVSVMAKLALSLGALPAAAPLDSAKAKRDLDGALAKAAITDR